jgi:hypothetical protein
MICRIAHQLKEQLLETPLPADRAKRFIVDVVLKIAHVVAHF